MTTMQNDVSCTKCGRSSPVFSNFCSGCGNQLIKIKPCINCGYSNPDDYKFCSSCGTRLSHSHSFQTLEPTPAIEEATVKLKVSSELSQKISGNENVVQNAKGDNNIVVGRVEGSLTINYRRPIGKLFQAPPLPTYYVDRPEYSQDLKNRLVAGLPDTRSLVVSAIHGLGSVGKSTLATALAYDEDVQAHFSDGILWATLGQKPDVLSLLNGWIQALDDYNFKPTSIEAASGHLRTLLYDKAVLVVVDDAWNSHDAQAFNVGGARCQVLVTTRDKAIADSLGASIYSLDVMTPEQAMELLTKKLFRSINKAEYQSASDLAKAVGYLPLALELIAAEVTSGTAWTELLDDFQVEVARLKNLNRPEAEEITDEAILKRFSLTASLNLSVSRMPKEKQQQFSWLGVLPEDINITKMMAATLWKMDLRATTKVLQYMHSKALLLPGVPLTNGTPTYRLHDLFHDLACNLLTAPTIPLDDGDLPGLGITLENAHAMLLERYQQKTQNNLWHTLPDDGYIHQRLVWHLEKAKRIEEIHLLLQEETESGSNGWYEASDHLGQTANFVTDVARAWQLAEEEWTQATLPKVIGLQCRYALIIASLNSLSANLPVELLLALIQKNVWTPEQGLAYVLQSSNPKQKANLLTELASNLPPNLKELALLKALAAAREIQSEKDRADALSSLAAKLPPELLPEALAAAREIQDEIYRATALSSLAAQLPLELLPEALAAAREIQHKFSRAIALSSLTGQIPKLLPEALAAAREIQHKFSRAIALSSLAAQLPELLLEALAAAREIQDESSRDTALSSLAAQLPELLLEALAAAREIQDESSRDTALSSLAAQLPELLLEALAAAREIQDESSRDTALSSLAVILPPELLPEALAAVREIQSEKDRVTALSRLAAQLPELLPEALAAAREIQSEKDRVIALSRLVAQLPELLPEALAAVRETQDDWGCADALSILAVILPPELLPEALAAAREIQDKFSRAIALSRFAVKLPELLPEALAVAREIQFEKFRADALSILAAKLPELLPEALAAAREIQDEKYRAEALSILAQILPPELLPEALAAAREIQDEYNRATALSSLAAQLPELLPKALAAAREIQDERDRAKALSILAAILPPELLPEALAAAREIQDDWGCADALSSLAPILPQELLPEALAAAREIQDEYNRTTALSNFAVLIPELLPEALAAAREIQSEIYRATALSSLAAQLPKLLPNALAAAREIQDEIYRASALCNLAQILPELFPEALPAAREIQDERDRASALSSLAAKLPELLPEALAAAREIQNERDRADALSNLAPILPPELLPEALAAAREIQNERVRADALSSLAPILPELLPEALAAAREIQNERDRADALSSLVAQLLQVQKTPLFSLWRDTLHILSVYTRPDLLSDINALTPVIFTLGDQLAVKDIAKAIQDVSRWWGYRGRRMQDVSIVDSTYIYLDLEVSTEEKIYHIGLVSPDLADNFSQQNLNQAYEQLSRLKKSGLAVCGHNFRRFDYPHLIKQQSKLSSLHIIDTLELSILAFPLIPSHKLSKDYKQSEYASNNPLEDAHATRLLLHQQLAALLKKPQSVLQVYTWLLTCGSTEADQAYQQLFCDILGWDIKPIALENFWQMMLKGINLSYLQQLWSSPEIYDFDTRLCVAALLAWNYESNVTESTCAFSNWLKHLSGFQDVLDSLCPLLLDNEQSISFYLKEFGIPSFRPLQEEVVKTILNGECPLVLMPTGGGKSLCYQLPALMFHRKQRGLTVVISPLQALMADQVADLSEAGIDFATFINGNLSAGDRRQRLEQLRLGNQGLLYISPEQLRSPSIRALLEHRPPVLWVIDEAHCISQWGHNFRPDYQYIPKFIKELYLERQLPTPLLALMTATATVAVQEDIKKLFSQHQLNIACTIGYATDRSNLTFEVIPVAGNKEQILLKKVKDALNCGGSILIYTTTRKNAEKIAELLNQSDIDAKYYHSKLAKEEKQEVLQAFKSGELNVVAATCAFGMGINRKDVRVVIHHCMSANLEGYVQEAGRAGRDERPSTCTLLFDPKDADTVFFLQSLNQLSEQDLRNTFISTRHLRNRTFDSAKEDWFWVTTTEIFQESELDEKFGLELEHRDTKIKVALHYLENFGLVERAENFSSYIQFELRYSNFSESVKQFEKYRLMRNLSRYEAENFERLIQAMHIAKAYCSDNDPFPLERLSDEAGISLHDLTSRIRELQKAEVCSFEIPITLLVTKGVRGDARNNYERLRQLEDELLNMLCEIKEDENEIQINMRGLASRLDPDNSKKIRASSIIDILEGWADQKWVKLNRVTRDVVKIRNIEVAEHLHSHKALAISILSILYEALGNKTGARLPLKYELGKLANEVAQKTQLASDSKELESVLLWLHQRKIIRLSEGLNLFQQSLKVRVIKNTRVSTVTRRYPEVKSLYDEQTKRTHTMLQYGKIKSPQQRQQFVADYFGEEHSSFYQKYQFPSTDVTTRPILKEEYDRIIEPLNPTQKEIVLASDPAMAIIAGPGSGKTRTIVHRIAHLVKVQRVEAQRIIVLAYNRNAVRELRLRLQKLIGEQAFGLRVFTFHGLALALLGRTLGEYAKTQAMDFDKILIEACELITKGEQFEDADDDTQARRIKLLGKLEYIFVDEYQDVSENEYRLIQLIAGLNDSEDESRSVQINLCVIGDDDQNIYGFRGTDTKYILQFEQEYKAKRLLLNENYRSTESIIQAANNLISNNKKRCKLTDSEQVRIDQHRIGHQGAPVEAYTFGNIEAQAVWALERIELWISQGVKQNEIAILARHWDNLSPVRLLLERAGITTYSLKTDGIRLVRNLVGSKLIDELKSQGHKVFASEESVQSWFQDCFHQWERNFQEPTVKVLLKIANDIDLERGFGSLELAVPISAADVLNALFEFNESPEVMLDEKAILVTSCHGAKGLEFRHVILLADGFTTSMNEIESERRLFYVAMTRAKEELVLCSTKKALFGVETGVLPKSVSAKITSLPQRMFYSDLTPGNVYLGHHYTKNSQHIIANILEGAQLQLKINRFKDGWEIFTAQGQLIGAFSKKTNADLAAKGFKPGQFEFQPGEVTVRSIYRHLKLDDLTGNVTEDWFVVIPQIRVCR